LYEVEPSAWDGHLDVALLFPAIKILALPHESRVMVIIVFNDALVREPTVTIATLFLNKLLEIHVRNVKIAPYRISFILGQTNFVISSANSA
jgi:hypothetical protein